MILGIVLAAGASRRMGSDKLNLPWRGATVLAATLSRWQAVPEIDELILVRRPGETGENRPGLRLLINQSADEGMGGSLRLAAMALPAATELVAVGLADMPDVNSATISTLIAAAKQPGAKGIIAPVFAGRRGHPVVFAARYIAELQKLSGDSGARGLLQKNAADLALVEVNDPGVVLDIDTPSDLEAQS